MSVLEAVDRDLVEMAKLLPGVDESTAAAVARSLAAELDAPGNSATSKSMCARALNETMGALQASLPEEREGNRLDELRARRDRAARGATS